MNRQPVNKQTLLLPLPRLLRSWNLRLLLPLVLLLQLLLLLLLQLLLLLLLLPLLPLPVPPLLLLLLRGRVFGPHLHSPHPLGLELRLGRAWAFLHGRGDG